MQRLGFPHVGRHRRFVTAMAVDAIGSGVFMPVSVLYFLNSTSLSLVHIGLALSIASGLRLPFAPLLGQVVDRIGAKQILLSANVIQALGFIGYVFADSFITVLAASAVVQIGQTAFWGSFSPVIAEISEAGERERWFGFLGALRNASFAIGGLVAALAITVGTTTAYTAVVLANAGSYVLAFALLLSVETSPTEASTASSPEGPQGWAQVLRDRAYLMFVLTNITYTSSAMALNIAMPVYITQSLDLPGWVAGVVFTINTVMIGVGQGLVVNAMGGSVRTNIIALGSLFFVASYAVMLAADWTSVRVGVVVMLVGTVVYTAGELVAGPVLSALSVEAAPLHLRGRYVSLYQMSWTVTSTVAPLALTWLLQRGAAPLWGSLATVSLLGIVLSQLLRRAMPLAAEAVRAAPVLPPPQEPVLPDR